MSKNTRRAAMPVLIMLLVAVLTLTGVTYAWFSQSNAVTLDTLDLEVEAADGILASWDAVDWKSSLSFDDDADKQVPTKTYPVSTVNEVSNGVASFFKGTITDEGKLYAVADPAGASAGYAKFDIYFKVEENTNLFLRADSFVKVTSGVRTDLAARVGFVDQGSKSGAEMTAANAIALTGGTEMVIWEPNAITHTDAGIAYGATPGAKTAYNGIKQAILSASAILPKVANETYLAPVTTKELSDLLPKSTSPSPIVQLETGFNKITVYIWIEGQDHDCLNDVSNNTIEVGLKFARCIDIASLEITSNMSNPVTSGNTVQLTATAKDSAGQTVVSEVVWEIVSGEGIKSFNNGTIMTEAGAQGSIVVKATSMYNASVFKEYTITFASE